MQLGCEDLYVCKVTLWNLMKFLENVNVDFGDADHCVDPVII